MSMRILMFKSKEGNFKRGKGKFLSLLTEKNIAHVNFYLLE